MKTKYYIAYGSNLSVEQMKFRTPDAKIIGTGILNHWQLLFRRFATIQFDFFQSKGFATPVLVWEISRKDERNLDRYEGFPVFYYKMELTFPVTSLDGQSLGNLPAMVYLMTREGIARHRGDFVPFKDYYSLIENAYEKFNFDKRILEAALKESLKKSVINSRK